MPDISQKTQLFLALGINLHTDSYTVGSVSVSSLMFIHMELYIILLCLLEACCCVSYSNLYFRC